MKSFRATAVVKHPPTEVATVMRDRLPNLAALLSDIDSVECLKREKLPDRRVRITHRWRAKIDLPASIKNIIGQDVAWLDHAVWSADGMNCNWTIEPLFLDGKVGCCGSAIYSPALGGRGTRVTFEGSVDLRLLRSGKTAGMEKMIAVFVEFVATSAVPRNLRRALDAAAMLLDGAK